MARQPRARAPQSAIGRDQHTHAAACRFARRAIDRQRSVRRSVRSPPQEPEQHHHQAADAGAARYRDDLDRCVLRPGRAASQRSRIAGVPAGSRRAGRRGEVRDRAELVVQQPYLLVSAGARDRLRDREAADQRAGVARVRRERRSRTRIADAAARQGRSAGPKALHVFGHAAASLSRVRGEPLRPVGADDPRLRLSVSWRERRRPNACDERGLLQQSGCVGRGEPAAGAADPRPRRADRRYRPVLCVARRRLSVPKFHDRARRERPARGPQPRLLRRAQSNAADLAVCVA